MGIQSRVHSLLPENDLYILISTHATKSLITRLWSETKIHVQRLISPLPLELTAGEASIVSENLKVFKRNGFEFLVGENGVSLTRKAFSKQTQFGVGDVGDLISLLMERTSEKERESATLPKVHDMYASRACRSSIMIGTPLTGADGAGCRNLSTLSNLELSARLPTLAHCTDLRGKFTSDTDDYEDHQKQLPPVRGEPSFTQKASEEMYSEP